MRAAVRLGFRAGDDAEAEGKQKYNTRHLQIIGPCENSVVLETTLKMDEQCKILQSEAASYQVWQPKPRVPRVVAV